MSNAKLDPRSLTVEELALLDQFALREYLHANTVSMAEKCYESGCGLILARRALFAPAASEPEKVECPNCNQATGHEGSHKYGNLTGDGYWWSCQPPQARARSVSSIVTEALVNHEQ